MKDSEREKTPDSFKFAVDQPTPTLKQPTAEQLEKRSYKSLYPIFCFKFLAEDDRHFPLKTIQRENFKTLLKKLKMYSHLKWGDIEPVRQHHAHEVAWHLTCKRSFPGECGDFPAYQFAVSESFRVIGFHREGAFYIVWLDVNHAFCKMH